MNKFIVRVELHGAEPKDYEDLYQKMKDAGFLTTIVGKKGIRYHLPTAQYCKSSLDTQDEILESAKSVVAKTKKEYSVLITESLGSSWYNLDEL